MGGKSSTSTNSVTVPADVLQRYNTVNAKACQAANTPFQKYSCCASAFVAPINSQQQTGIAGVNAAASEAQPYYGAATSTLMGAQAATQPYYSAATAGTTGAAATGKAYNQAATGLAAAGTQAVCAAPITGACISKYMSPYLSNVVGSESALLNQNNQQQQAGQLGTAISSGAFGGCRAGIAAANLSQQQNLANANIYSNLLNTGYNNALCTAKQQQGVSLSAGQANRSALQTGACQVAKIGQQCYSQGLGAASQLAGLGQDIYNTGAATSSGLANLGTGAQSAAESGAQAQLAAGTLQQQTCQAGKTALYNQFLQQQSYPFQVDQFLANIAEGTGSLSGSTTTTSQPGGFFSDERLKEDIHPVGKTFDGQTIYSYRYKGEDRTQIGLLAQDVEKKHPHAVGLAAGYKTVDYGKATHDASERGHFKRGGLAAANDDYWEEPRKQYATGGGPTGISAGDLASLLQAQETMYGQSGGLYGQGTTGVRGASSYVPAATVPVSHLMTAQPVSGPPTSGLHQVEQLTNLATSKPASWAENQIGNTIKGLGSKGGSGGSGSNLACTASCIDQIVSQDLKRGGVAAPRQGYACGGMPYVGAGPAGLDIPDQQPSAKLQPAGGAGGSGKCCTMSTIMDAAKIAAMFMNRGGAAGGRKGYAGGGDITCCAAPAYNPADYQNLVETFGDKPIDLGGTPPIVESPNPKGSASATPDGDLPVPPQSGLGAAMDTVKSGLGGIGDTVSKDANAVGGVLGKFGQNLANGAGDAIGRYGKGLASGCKADWLSLLSGIGAMGTAPTRSLGVALASGLQGGTKAYQEAQNQQAALAKTQADIARTKAETQGVQTVNRAAIAAAVKSGMMILPDPNGKIVDETGAHYTNYGTKGLVQGAAHGNQLGAQPAGDSPSVGDQPAAPAATGQAPGYKYLGQTGEKLAGDAFTNYQLAPDPQKAASDKEITQVNQDGQSASSSRLGINKYATAFASNKGPLEPGAAAPLIAPAVGMINSWLDKIPGGEGMKIDPGSLTNSQIVDKMSKTFGFLRANGADERSLAALDAAISTTPNSHMDRTAGISLLTDMYLDNQMKDDKAHYMQEFQNASGALNGQIMSRDALNAFNADHPTQQYERDRHTLNAVIADPRFAPVQRLLANPDPKKQQAAIQMLDHAGGPGFHRYFTGGQ